MVGFLFSGQGSQYIGMGRDLYEAFPESRVVFEKVDEALGFGLKARCFEGPEDLLKLTSVSQPAILTVSLAAFAAFRAKNDLMPAYSAGLSLGEYTTLVAAGCLTLEDGIKLVRKRGEIMEQAATRVPGKMAAVLELPLEKLKEICALSHAEIANLNSPVQSVISGRAEAVEQAMDLCNKAGAKRVIALEVSGGFHSSLMLEAAKELRAVLEKTRFSLPAFPVVSNYSAGTENTIQEIKDNLERQMYSPVRWEESMRFMLSKGVKKFYEFGPGRILKGLMRKIDPEAEVITIEKKDDIDNL
jgi:[acyl-carrier-protein] S-malonyltransferase